MRHNVSEIIEKRNNKENLVDFGYQQVPASEKQYKVKEVFDSVASKYDLMNDLMSLGVHRYWKKMAIFHAKLFKGQTVLDLAGGTGDLTFSICKKVGQTGYVVLSDINNEMLQVGVNRSLDNGSFNQIGISQANAEQLSFKNYSFDRIFISFGLRNVTNKPKALKSMFDCLKPGGRLTILEFSKPVLPVLSKIYDAYSFSILPLLGKIICNDANSYQYLAESIRKHPDQKTLLTMMEEAGFENCSYHNLSQGIVAIHCGLKIS
jgi:demethylmenaquinone methyltransferase/2-methoxy-6-polyprenyl-1,4-benzoquinol methylase